MARRLALGLITLALVACKPGEQGQTETSGTTTTEAPAGTDALPSAASRDPLVQRAQTALNQRNQGRACTTFNMSGKFQATEQNESVSYPLENRDLPAYQQWAYLSARGVAQRNENVVNGRTYEEFTPRRDLKESGGQGVYVPDGRYLSYCYGRWTVTAAERTDAFQPSSSDKEAVTATVTLTDAPDWATSEAANILNQPNGTSERYGTLLVAVNEYDKGVPARLDQPSRVWVEVPKE